MVVAFAGIDLRRLGPQKLEIELKVSSEVVKIARRR